MASRPLLRRLARSDRGAVLVEFALTLPLLLVIFATIVQGGHMMWSYQTAIAGVRDAARYAARTQSSGVCPGPLPDVAALNNSLKLIVRDSIGGVSVLPPSVSLDPASANPVVATLTCVTKATGSYRLAQTPVVTVTAKIRIDLPFAGIFALAGDALPTSIVTTISDQSRVFGS